MSLRSSLSPNQKFSIIVASLAALMIAEAGGLFVLSQRYPTVHESATTEGRTETASPTAENVSSASIAQKPTTAPANVFTVPGEAPAATGNALAQNGGNPLAPIGKGTGLGAIVPSPGTAGTAPKNNLTAKPGEKEAPQKAEARAAFQTGVAALEKKDAKGAIESFERVVALVPDNLPSHLNLASLYLETNQPQKALSHLEKAAVLDPKSAAVRFNMGRTLLALKRTPEALAALRETVRLAPKERDGHLLLAQVLTQTRQTKEAYKQWTLLAERDKRDLEAHLTAAAIANDVLNEPKTAEKWLRRSIQGSPRDPQAPILLSRLLLGRNQFKDAITILTAATKARPDVFEFYPLLANARSATGDTKGAVSAIQSALLRLPQGKSPEEKKRIAFAEGGLRITLGQTLGNAKRVKEASAEFQKAAKLRPTDPQPRTLGAIASLQLKDAPTATRLLQEAVRLDPKGANNRKLLAQLYAESKKWKDADAQMALYNTARPRDIEALFLWAQIARAGKDSRREKQVVQQMTQVAPTNPVGWAQLGVLQRELGDKKAALATFTKLSALTPKDPSPPFEMARLQTSLGNYEAAFASWQKVVRNKPDYPLAYTFLLQSGDEAKERGAARAFLVRQMSGRSENVKALQAVLNFYEGKKRPEEAKAFLNDLVARNPKFVAAKAALDSYATPKAETPKTTENVTPATAKPEG